MSRTVTGLEKLVASPKGEAGLGAGSRVGLLAHAASIGPDGRHAVALLREEAGLDLVRLFSPEHGLYGEAQDMESVDDGTDSHTGLPVVSLYGDSAASLRPRAEDLADLDAVICDLQDVGSRYYTFVYTIAYVMEAAGAAGVPVVVLDRPNPLGGAQLEGPVLDPGLASFVGRFPLPVRHAMTAGELARMFRDRFGAACDLRVVAMDGWRRESAWEDTGLPWVPPSPNMPTAATARVYPGGCLIEGTNLSEGRGTTTPFELVGAPWVDPGALATTLRAARLEGVAFRPAAFRPMFQKHASRSCRGVQIIVTEPTSFRPLATYLHLIADVLERHPGDFDWRREAYEFEAERLAIDLLLGRHGLRQMLEEGVPVPDIEATWAPGLAAFAAERRPHLLYS